MGMFADGKSGRGIRPMKGANKAKKNVSKNWFDERDVKLYARHFGIFLTNREGKNPFETPTIKKRGRPNRTILQNLLRRMITYWADVLVFLKKPSNLLSTI